MLYTTGMALTAEVRAQALALVRLGQGKVSVELAMGLRAGVLRAEMRSDPEFARDWAEAVEDSTEAIEEAMRERALSGDTVAATAYLKAKGAKEWKPAEKSVEVQIGVMTADEVLALASRMEARRIAALPPVAVAVQSRGVVDNHEARALNTAAVRAEHVADVPEVQVRDPDTA